MFHFAEIKLDSFVSKWSSPKKDARSSISRLSEDTDRSVTVTESVHVIKDTDRMNHDNGQVKPFNISRTSDLICETADTDKMVDMNSQLSEICGSTYAESGLTVGECDGHDSRECLDLGTSSGLVLTPHGVCLSGDSKGGARTDGHEAKIMEVMTNNPLVGPGGDNGQMVCVTRLPSNSDVSVQLEMEYATQPNISLCDSVYDKINDDKEKTTFDSDISLVTPCSKNQTTDNEENGKDYLTAHHEVVDVDAIVDADHVVVSLNFQY